tara:strand:- start:1184 stop:2038 length:855 start_codon:yes stop_codon:yes gene_type:complete
MSYTYTQLKTSIKDYTDNVETVFVSHLPDFIKTAEERILKEVDLDFFRKNVSGTMTSGNKFLAVPNDYLASFSLSLTNSSLTEFLLLKDVNFLQEFTPNPATTGVPKYYALYDYQNFILAPTPNDNFATELHYYYRPASLTSSKVTLTVNNVTGVFASGETITGGTSGESTTINSLTSATELVITVPVGDLTVGETVTGATSGATGVVVSTSADTTTTWISENAKNTLLYACLIEAYTFMKGETDLLQLYMARYTESAQRLQNYARGVENSDAYREGLVRANKT